MTRFALFVAFILGCIADLLLNVPGRPGLNAGLWAVAGVIGLCAMARRRTTPVAVESGWLVGGALLCAWLLMLRDAEALAAFSILGGIVLLGMAAGRAAQAWASRSYLTDIAAAAVRVGVLIALGPIGWAFGSAPTSGRRKEGEGVWPARVRTASRGAALALPVLVVLIALLTSADPVFKRLLQDTLFFDIQPLLEHLAFAGFIAWITSGYLRALLISDDHLLDRVRIPRPGIASAEITVALVLLNLLFIAFLLVQLRYLFGGANLVEVTAGLSYADYARRGFFEMVAATVFVVPVLLIADWAGAEDEEKHRRMQRATSTLLVLLLLGVLASAAFRMKLYQDAYGLTEDRVFGSMFMIWLGGVLLWLAFTVLRGRRERFAFGAIVAGAACLVLLHVVNPHALIARVNIARAIAGEEYDGRYLRTLSADAVPVLVSELPQMPVTERCATATMLRKRWSGARPGGWRAWNFSDGRARRLVATLGVPTGCVIMR